LTQDITKEPAGFEQWWISAGWKLLDCPAKLSAKYLAAKLTFESLHGGSGVEEPSAPHTCNFPPDPQNGHEATCECCGRVWKWISAEQTWETIGEIEKVEITPTKLLSKLLDGLPKSLWGWDIEEIKSAMRQFQSKHPGKLPSEVERAGAVQEVSPREPSIKAALDKICSGYRHDIWDGRRCTVTVDMAVKAAYGLAEAEVRELREALKDVDQYVQHQTNCSFHKSSSSLSCTCGLRDSLSNFQRVLARERH